MTYGQGRHVDRVVSTFGQILEKDGEDQLHDRVDHGRGE